MFTDRIFSFQLTKKDPVELVIIVVIKTFNKYFTKHCNN